MSSYQRMVHVVETSKYGPSVKQRDSNVLLWKLQRYFSSRRGGGECRNYRSRPSSSMQLPCI